MSVVAVVAFAGGSLTNIQRQFIRERVRLVSRDTQTIPGKVINHFRKGQETWAETNTLSRITASAGRRVSKLKLIVNLKELGKWQDVKIFIRQADLEDEWLNCSYIDTNYQIFMNWLF